MSFPPTLTIRFATPADCGTILSFIQQLAAYEKLAHEVVATEASLRATLFGVRRSAEVLIATLDQPVGFALFFESYSTFLAKPGMYLEDLYVREDARHQGIGSALLGALARIAVQRHYGRFEWSVLDWNEPALRLYRAVGATAMSEWTVQRLTGDALARLAERWPEPVGNVGNVGRVK
ncbi:MAG: N-acetyltransferase family protein [Kofleriaceae bacterium]